MSHDVIIERNTAMYIHEYDNWTNFVWDSDQVNLLLDKVSREQGRLYGRLSVLGFDDQLQAMAENLTRDVVFSSEIEGVRLNMDEVRSSIARRLGIDGYFSASSRYIDAVVEVMFDAIKNYDKLLTKERLCGWQSVFFPMGLSNGISIEIGQYRTHEEHIVSGYLGRERVHYIAPSPDRLEFEMNKFLDWFNSEQSLSPIIRSAIAHFWFVSIHPFEDGNGRLARILGDIFLARADNSSFRFYNITSEINRDKKHYYEVLERVQRGSGDITEWLVWYLTTLYAAILEAEVSVKRILNKSLFWMNYSAQSLNQRQISTLNLFLDGYEGKITSKMWASLNKCSKDTAIRDIQDLVNKNILLVDILGAKRPSYSINYNSKEVDITKLFTEVHVERGEEESFLTAKYRETIVLRERILQLDAERYLKGDLPLNHLLSKYCSYLIH